MDVRFRPIGSEWPGRRNPEPRYSPFKASFRRTMETLERELNMLQAKNVVIQIDLRESQIRLDGWPKSGASNPAFPGVILAFDSKFGPLKYSTDEFHHWEDNLRGIALALEALRKVDRYGVSRRGEQYAGWKALGAGAPDDDLLQRGRELIAEYGGATAALKATHPDAGGDEEDFKAVDAARRA